MLLPCVRSAPATWPLVILRISGMSVARHTAAASVGGVLDERFGGRDAALRGGGGARRRRRRASSQLGPLRYRALCPPAHRERTFRTSERNPYVNRRDELVSGRGLSKDG